MYDIHDAVWYNDLVARVEDRAVGPDDSNMYLILLSNHRYHWVSENHLQRYIG